jgi:hypothetical protein
MSGRLGKSDALKRCVVSRWTMVLLMPVVRSVTSYIYPVITMYHFFVLANARLLEDVISSAAQCTATLRGPSIIAITCGRLHYFCPNEASNSPPANAHPKPVALESKS